jgi:hypothetical protein
MKSEAFEQGLLTHEAGGERASFRTRVADVVRGAWRRLIASQEAKARDIAYRHLATRSDITLRDLGFSPGEIERIRACRRPADPHWYVR